MDEKDINLSFSFTDEYGIKIIENPTEEQKAQFEKDCQSILDWIRAMKEFAVSNE